MTEGTLAVINLLRPKLELTTSCSGHWRYEHTEYADRYQHQQRQSRFGNQSGAQGV